MQYSFIHRYAREFESGSDHETHKRSPKMIAEMLFEMPPSVERLIDKVVDIDDIEYEPVGIKNMKYFLRAYLMLIAFCIIVLGMEIIITKSGCLKNYSLGTEEKGRRKRIKIKRGSQISWLQVQQVSISLNQTKT